MKSVCFLIFIFLLCVSCAPSNCIKLEGSYGEFAGGIEYCFDLEESKEKDVPVLQSENGKNYILSEQQIVELKAILNGNKIYKLNKDEKSILNILNGLD